MVLAGTREFLKYSSDRWKEKESTYSLEKTVLSDQLRELRGISESQTAIIRSQEEKIKSLEMELSRARSSSAHGLSPSPAIEALLEKKMALERKQAQIHNLSSETGHQH